MEWGRNRPPVDHVKVLVPCTCKASETEEKREEEEEEVCIRTFETVLLTPHHEKYAIIKTI